MDAQKRAIVEEISQLRRYARRLLRDRDAADDLIQDGLKRALSRMENWTTGESPRRCLFAIIHRLFVDQLRRANRNVSAATLMPGVIDVVAATTEQPNKVSSAEMLAVLEQIAPERRAALMLVAIEGLSYADAAYVLGIPAGMLTSRIARGREDLRALLDDVSR